MSFQPGRRALLAAFAGILPIGPAVAAPERVRVVGYLSGGGPGERLARPLREFGFEEGRNLRIETRVSNETDATRLNAVAAGMVALRPDALVAFGPRAVALAGATRSIPIVCAGVPDPEGAGLARSLRMPGGNVTGLADFHPDAANITIGLLKRLRPGLRRVGEVHALGLASEAGMRTFARAAQVEGLEWMSVPVDTEAQVESALSPFAGQAVVVGVFPQRILGKRLFEVATALRIMVLSFPEWNEDPVMRGSLMSYSMRHGDGWQRIAGVVAKVLRGADPAGIPFELPDRTAFIWNRRIARELGVELPQDLALRVTEFVD